jgi:hypothetical protein
MVNWSSSRNLQKKMHASCFTWELPEKNQNKMIGTSEVTREEKKKMFLNGSKWWPEDEKSLLIVNYFEG